MTEYTSEGVDERLEDICEEVHSSCNNRCPVFEVNHEVPDSMHNFKKNRGCDCFKDGKAMRLFLLGAIECAKRMVANEEKFYPEKNK
jgi:hypothetical protein